MFYFFSKAPTEFYRIGQSTWVEALYCMGEVQYFVYNVITIHIGPDPDLVLKLMMV